MKRIRSGQTTRQDPNDSRVYALNWSGENLAEGVELIDAGVITITVNDDSSPLLVDDELALLTGNRSARVRLTGGILGRLYRVSHRITTNEVPAQIKEQSFFVLIQNG